MTRAGEWCIITNVASPEGALSGCVDGLLRDIYVRDGETPVFL